MLLEFLHSPNFILSILFNNIFTLISENVFWVEDSPAPAMGALYSIINEIVVHVKKKTTVQSELIISCVHNVQGTKKDVMSVKKVIINKFK